MTSPTPKPTLSGWALALDRGPVGLTVLLLLLLPFLTRPGGYDPLLPKSLLLGIVTAALALFYAFQALRFRCLVWMTIPAWIPLGALTIWMAVTVVVSPYSAEGWIRLGAGLLPFLWFALLSLHFREVWRIENLLVTFLAGALGVSLWSIAQALGWSADPWTEWAARHYGGRVMGGFGNPNFLAGYLLSAWPMALALLLRAKSGFAKGWWGITLLSVLAALVLTGSRSGWLGFVAGTVVFALFLVFGKTSKPLKNAAWGLLLFAALLTPLTPAGQRMMGNGESGDEAFRFRKHVWSGTLLMIAERPLTGWGYGAFEAAFPAHRPQALALEQAQRSFSVDHAHNALLEWTAETGLVGLALLIWFWISVGIPWWSLTVGGAVPRPLGAAAFAVGAGVFVSNLLDVNHATLGTWVPLFLVAALPSALFQRFHHLSDSPVHLSRLELKSRLPLAVLAAALLLVGFFWTVDAAFKRQSADAAMATARAATEDRNWDQAIDGFRKAVSLDPQALEGWYFLGSSLLDRGNDRDLPEALDAFRKVKARQSDFVRLHSLMGTALEKSGSLEEARVEKIRAVRLDPNEVTAHPDFMRIGELARAGKAEEALRLVRALAAEFPDCFPLMMDEANCLALLYRTVEAQRLLEKALRLWPESVDGLLNLGYVALAGGDETAARQSLHALQRLHPNEPRLAALTRAVETRFQKGS